MKYFHDLENKIKIAILLKMGWHWSPVTINDEKSNHTVLAKNNLSILDKLIDGEYCTEILIGEFNGKRDRVNTNVGNMSVRISTISDSIKMAWMREFWNLNYWQIFVTFLKHTR